jgi:hypothetical protein
MKTLVEINKTLAAFEKRFGLKVQDAQQGSEAWFNMKLGVISASNASKLIMKRDAETRLTYMAELVAQVCTGVMEELSFKQAEWGKDHEDAARASYEFAAGVSISPLCFVFKDDSFREGCSPDGIVTKSRGCEIKCPWNTANYIKFLVTDKIKPEYVAQYQYTMRVMNAEEWDFVQFDPRMKAKPLHVVRVVRDETMQKRFDEAVPEFIYDMDEMLKTIGIDFGDQWKRLAAIQRQIA